MKQTTLCFLIKEGKVLLAMKKRGFGIGKWNGVGGKIKEGEDLKESAIREVQEEIGVVVRPDELNPVGTLYFNYRDNPDWEQLCNVFIVQTWDGEPSESEEMKPEWYPIDRLPFEAMWVDDPQWLPLVLVGKKIEGKFLFDKTGETMLDYKVDIKQ